MEITSARGFFSPQSEQRLDHAPAVVTAIHIVAEKDECRPLAVARRPRIGRDLAKHVGKQVDPAVNVTHCVEELALWQCGMIQAW